MKTFSGAYGLFFLLCFGQTSAMAAEARNNETTAMVYFERIEDNKVCSSKKECDEKIRDFVDTIPNVTESDLDVEKDRIYLLIPDKRLVSVAILKSQINKGNIIKAKKILIPAPKEKLVEKDPFEGKSKSEIKKAYDDYYRENPDLKPKNWEFSK